ncbi:Uncharacterised protein [Orientia tsutsugamushi]|uniref:Uncharacterized protein n=1 Tax=Orientia tsutsugamushi TaxID=784 RepID=A0A2U3RA86_ORITS|nr:Uncharacterised protein [Orientia tsutsugamushi]
MISCLLLSGFMNIVLILSNLSKSLISNSNFCSRAITFLKCSGVYRPSALWLSYFIYHKFAL